DVHAARVAGHVHARDTGRRQGQEVEPVVEAGVDLDGARRAGRDEALRPLPAEAELLTVDARGDAPVTSELLRAGRDRAFGGAGRPVAHGARTTVRPDPASAEAVVGHRWPLRTAADAQRRKGEERGDSSPEAACR